MKCLREWSWLPFSRGLFYHYRSGYRLWIWPSYSAHFHTFFDSHDPVLKFGASTLKLSSPRSKEFDMKLDTILHNCWTSLKWEILWNNHKLHEILWNLFSRRPLTFTRLGPELGQFLAADTFALHQLSLLCPMLLPEIKKSCIVMHKLADLHKNSRLLQICPSNDRLLISYDLQRFMQAWVNEACRWVASGMSHGLIMFKNTDRNWSQMVFACTNPQNATIKAQIIRNIK